MDETLGPKEVLRIRDRLGDTREGLAARLQVSKEAVRSWEEGNRSCKGPARLLLLLLERSPNILGMLDDEPTSLPRLDALPSTPEWFRLQRLLGIIGHFRSLDYWDKICIEEEGRSRIVSLQ